MMIANIVNGKNLARNQGPTLIVAPSSLVHQWHNECLKHADTDKKALGRVVRYCAGHRGGEMPLEQYFKNYQLIITTYADISASYPKSDVPAGMDDPVEKQTWWDNYYEKQKGAFHRIQFHRVILDEAHAIKNYKSMTSIACRALDATHRWAISGTPSQNSLTEFYPYFKFLQMTHTGDFKSFKSNYCTDDDPAGSQRLAAMLRKVMLRRTHGDTLMGSKLLNLPDTEYRDYECQLSDIERGLYDVVHKRFVKRINGFAKQGQLQKQYSNVLVMLLRLRQLVAHPLLIQDTIKDLLEPEDFDELGQVINAPTRFSSAEEATIKHLRRMLRSPNDLATLDSFKDLADATAKNGTIVVDDDGKGEAFSKRDELGREDGMDKKDDDNEADNTEIGNIEADGKGTNDKATEIPIQEEEAYIQSPEKSTPSTRARNIIDLTDNITNINTKEEKVSKSHRNLTVECIDVTEDEADETPGYHSKHKTANQDKNPKARRAKFDESNIGGLFGTRSSYGDWLSDMKTQAALEDQEPVVECVMCHRPPQKAVMTSCDHVYCNDCLRDLADACRERGELMTKCISCDEYCSQLRKNTSSNMFTQSTAAAINGEETTKKKPSIKTVIDTWVDEKGMMLPSAKTLAFKAQVLNWLQQDPSVKIM